MTQLFIIFSFLVWAISLLGLGCFANKFIKKWLKDFEISEESRILYYGTLGFIVISVVGTIFNFFISLGAAFSMIILTIGIALFFFYRKNILPAWQSINILGVFIPLSYSCLLSVTDLKNYDTFLYHMPMIKLISSSALPFGLANLNDKFGFNSAWFIDASVVSPLKFLTNSPFFIINAIAYFFFGTFIFLALVRMIKESRINLSSIFVLTTFIPWCYCLTSFISSPSPDVPTMLLTLFVTFLLIKNFETKNINYLFVALIISFYIVTIKLSAVPYFAEIFMILFILFIFKNYLKNINSLIIAKLSMIKYIIAGIILSIMAIPYLIKGIISSGYIAFPSTFGHINLKWSVPVDSAISAANYIKSWAEKPGADSNEVLGNWNWLKPWFYQVINDKSLVCAFIIGIIIVIVCFILKKIKYLNVFAFIFCLSLIGCLFWFFTAPALRFGYGYLYSSICILLAYGIFNLLDNKMLVNSFLKLTFVIFILTLFFQNNINFKEVYNISETKREAEWYFNRPLMSISQSKENLKIIFDKNNNPKIIWIEK